MKYFGMIIALSVAFPLLWAQPTMAYVGPGLGIGAIGTVLGVVFSILLAIGGIFWHPVKRWLEFRKNAEPGVGEDQTDER